MKVSELIELLKQCDPDQEVKIWNEFGDIEPTNVEWNCEYQQHICIS